MFVTNALDQLRRATTHRFQTERGEVTIEWGVLVVFIALAMIAVVGVVTGGINTWFGKIAAFINTQPGSPPA